MATRRAGVLQRRPRQDRNTVRARQRLPRNARQPRGGSRGAQPRHVPERVPRDLADPARRGCVRVRQDRPDHRQRARRQVDEAVRRRRAAAADVGRSGHLRASGRLPQRGAHPRHDLADAVGQAGPCVVAADGQPRAPSPRSDDAGGHTARFARPDRDLVAAAQPPGRRGRVPRPLRCTRRRQGSEAGPKVRSSGAATTSPARARQRDRPRLPVREQRDDAGVRDPPSHRDVVRRRGRHRRRRRSGQDRVHRASHSRRSGEDHQTRGLSLVEWRSGARARRSVHPDTGAGRIRGERPAAVRATRMARRVLVERGHRTPRRRPRPAGPPLEPVPARSGVGAHTGAGHRRERRDRGRLRRSLLLGHRGLRRPVPVVHESRGGPEDHPLPMEDARRAPANAPAR